MTIDRKRQVKLIALIIGIAIVAAAVIYLALTWDMIRFRSRFNKLVEVRRKYPELVFDTRMDTMAVQVAGRYADFDLGRLPESDRDALFGTYEQTTWAPDRYVPLLLDICSTGDPLEQSIALSELQSCISQHCDVSRYGPEKGEVAKAFELVLQEKELVLSLLRNSDWRVRCAAIDVEAVLELPQAEQVLLQLLDKDPHPRVRTKAFCSIIYFRSGSSPAMKEAAKKIAMAHEPMLAAMLFTENLISDNCEKRKEACKQLVKIGKPAVPALIGVLNCGDYSIAWSNAPGYETRLQDLKEGNPVEALQEITGERYGEEIGEWIHGWENWWKQNYSDR